MSADLYDKVTASVSVTQTGCWEWVRGRSKAGYGMLRDPVKRTMVTAHRVAFEHHNGPIPPKAHICHTCDNPPCCNPEHLWLGTASDNSRDMVLKGRSTSPLTPGQVSEIRGLLQQRVRQVDIAALFGVTQSCVSLIKLGKTWK